MSAVTLEVLTQLHREPDWVLRVLAFLAALTDEVSWKELALLCGKEVKNVKAAARRLRAHGVVRSIDRTLDEDGRTVRLRFAFSWSPREPLRLVKGGGMHPPGGGMHPPGGGMHPSPRLRTGARDPDPDLDLCSASSPPSSSSPVLRAHEHGGVRREWTFGQVRDLIDRFPRVIWRNGWASKQLQRIAPVVARVELEDPSLEEVRRWLAKCLANPDIMGVRKGEPVWKHPMAGACEPVEFRRWLAADRKRRADAAQQGQAMPLNRSAGKQMNDAVRSVTSEAASHTPPPRDLLSRFEAASRTASRARYGGSPVQLDKGGANGR